MRRPNTCFGLQPIAKTNGGVIKNPVLACVHFGHRLGGARRGGWPRLGSEHTGHCCPGAGYAPPEAQRIQFQPNATSAILGNVLPPGGSDRFVLKATAGQTLIVNLAMTAGQASLAITGADGTPLVSDVSGTIGWSDGSW